MARKVTIELTLAEAEALEKYATNGYIYVPQTVFTGPEGGGCFRARKKLRAAISDFVGREVDRSAKRPPRIAGDRRFARMER